MAGTWETSTLSSLTSRRTAGESVWASVRRLRSGRAAAGGCFGWAVARRRAVARVLSGCGRLLGRLRRWRSIGRVDGGDGRSDGDGFALGDGDAQHARAGGRDVAGGLVGFELEEGLAGLDERAVGLVPAREDSLGDRLADGGDGDGNGRHG